MSVTIGVQRRDAVVVLCVVMVLTMAVPGATAANVEMSFESLSQNPKIVGELVQELLNTPESDYLDVIVSCNENITSNLLDRLSVFSRGLEIEKTWTCIPGFRAKMHPSQVLGLTESERVHHIRNNTCYHDSLSIDWARYCTSIDSWLGWPLSEPTGDMNGNRESYSKYDIVVAVFDSGIWNSHTRLDGGKVLAFVDFTGTFQSDTSPPIVSYDDNGHGTQMASIIAGNAVASPVSRRGVAPGAALVAIKTHDSGGSTQMDWILNAIQWVGDNRVTYGIEIASMSFGIPIWSSYENDDIAQAADWLYSSNGVVVVVAAGNKNNDGNPLPRDARVTTPGTGRCVATVGAVKDPLNGLDLKWSRWLEEDDPMFIRRGTREGPTHDGAVKPDIFAPGYNIDCATISGSTDYCAVTGTSPATAFVAGLVALYIDYDINLKGNLNSDTNPDVKELLMASATEIPDDSIPGHDGIYGSGIVDAIYNRDFHDTDISAYYWNAPTVIDEAGGSYSRNDEPMWVRDPSMYTDWFRLDTGYNGEQIHVEVSCDPDLMVLALLLDKNRQTIIQQQSIRGGTVSFAQWTSYAGVYYIKVCLVKIQSNQYYVSGDFYDIFVEVLS